MEGGSKRRQEQKNHHDNNNDIQNNNSNNTNNKEITIKYIMLKCIKPLLIVRSLKGTGENPAIASRVIQAITPPSEETLFFQKYGSTP